MNTFQILGNKIRLLKGTPTGKAKTAETAETGEWFISNDHILYIYNVKSVLEGDKIHHLLITYIFKHNIGVTVYSEKRTKEEAMEDLSALTILQKGGKEMLGMSYRKFLYDPMHLFKKDFLILYPSMYSYWLDVQSEQGYTVEKIEKKRKRLMKYAHVSGHN